MADGTAWFRVGLATIGQILLFATAWYFLTLQGDRRQTRLFAFILLLQAAAMFPVWETVAPIAVTWPPQFAGQQFFYFIQQPIGHLTECAIVLFCAIYPTRVRAWSAEAWLFGLLAAYPLAADVLTFAQVFPEAIRVDLLDTYSGPLKVDLAIAILAAAVRCRGTSLERGANLVLSFLFGGYIFILGHAAPQFVLYPLGIAYRARYAIDPGTTLATFLAPPNLETIAAPAALLVYFSLRRSWYAISVFALGMVWFGLYQWSSFTPVDVVVTLTLLVPAYAVRRHHAFGALQRDARNDAVFAAFAGLFTLAVTLAGVNDFVGFSSTAVSIGTLVAFAGGSIVFVYLLPRGIAGPVGVALEPGHGLMFRGGKESNAAVVPAEPKVGSLVLNRYRIRRLLGEGGQAGAYLAQDETIRRDVVLKVLSTPKGADAERALEEARLLAAVEDPHVVRLYDAVPMGTSTILVLEFVEGPALRDLLHPGVGVRPDEADRIMADVLSGLAATHAQGVVHGDLKPENVLLDKTGRARIIDFGLARAVRPQATMVEATAGTFGYLSPERMDGRPPSTASDINAAGIVYLEMLTGDRNPSRAIEDGKEGDEPSEARRAVLRRALARDPTARFATAGAMREALCAAVPGSSFAASVGP
ncbi:MAG: serine/threonine-protein kinase [Thermoplasmatota archaeon]